MSQAVPVAGLERRFLAFVVDRLLVWVPSVAVGAVTAVLSDGLLTALVAALGTAALLWLALAVVLGLTGTSPGKSLTGLRVVHHGAGTPVGVGPALVRAAVLSSAGLPTFGLGIATLAWTAAADPGRQRRGWHDHLARSVVVDVRPAPVVAVAADDAPRHVVNLTAMRLVPAPAVEVPAVPQPAPRAPAPPHVRPTAPQQPPPRSADDPGRTVVRGPVAPPAAPRWRVIFDDGHSFVVEGPVLVGRRPEPRPGEPVRHLVPLASTDMSVSKTHAQIGQADDGALVVMDRGSTNGTVLRRSGVARRLSPGHPSTLLAGDTVVFGDREMTLLREP